MNYYNENDAGAAQWLRNLIDAGEIPAGDVDERSIEDVTGNDVSGYAQAHFFAGVGGWPLALRLAGWPDDRPVWTGSCPCQPFSCAGKRKGTADKRHLWPDMRRLIAECRPSIIFGEQVSSKDGRLWLTGVRTDLEELGYGVGAADLCAAGIGSPHIRQRLYWMADAGCLVQSWAGYGAWMEEIKRCKPIIDPEPSSVVDGLADAEHSESGMRESGIEGHARKWRDRPSIDGAAGGLDNALISRPQGHTGDGDGTGRAQEARPTPAEGAWSDFFIVHCRDGKSRRVGRGIAPLAHGFPRSVGQVQPELLRLHGLAKSSLKAAKGNRLIRLRGYGNAIVPQLAAEFISAAMECAA